MSMARLVFPILCWSELAHILSFLDFEGLLALGSTGRSAFITFMREKPLRKLKPHQLNNACFLSKGSGQSKVLLVSYPRSGNSFLRKLLETETSIITGSDSRPNRTLSASLLQCGYKGEGIVDDSVWVVKSHFPERLGYVKFNASRVILLVRNPFDAIESYYHMGFTNTHDRMLTPEAFETLREHWSPCVTNEAKIWTHFHEYWKRQAGTVPILLIRYEDLLTDEKGVMREVLRFMSEATVPVGLSRYMTKAAPEPPAAAVASLSIGEKNQVNCGCTSGCSAGKSTQPASGPGYQPKKKKVGKALRPGVMGESDVLQIVRTASLQMNEFGYDLEVSQNPKEGQFGLVVKPLTNEKGEAVLARRMVALPAGAPIAAVTSAATAPVEKGSIRVNESFSVRHNEDTFGRLFTVLRRGLTADDAKPFPTM